MKRLSFYTVVVLSGLLAVASLGCDSGAAASQGAAASVEPDCASPSMQQALTYCASPAAALEGTRVAEARASARAGQSDATYLPVPIQGSPSLGPEEAPVTIVLFGDFECGFCAQGYDTLRAMQKAQPEKIRLVFKHLPLEFHHYARNAAHIGVVAAEQGKFWEYADALFQHRGELTPELIESEASALGIATDRAKTEDAIHQKVVSDESLAQTLRIDATPSIVINGIAQIGVPLQADLEQTIAEQLAVAQALSQAGLAAKDLYWRMTLAQYAPVPQEEPQQESPPAPPTIAHVPIDPLTLKGDSEKALITIVEFADFECPYCKDAGATLDRAIASLGSDASRVRVSYRHYPLNFHQHAESAAALSVLAAESGKFWPVHDALFAAQETLNHDAIVRVGVDAGLGDQAQVEQAIAEQKRVDRVRQDVALGAKHGVQATPAFFVNGELHMGAPDEAAWAELLQTQLQVARKVQEETKGSGEELYEAIVAHQRSALENLEPASVEAPLDSP